MKFNIRTCLLQLFFKIQFAKSKPNIKLNFKIIFIYFNIFI